MRLPTWQVSASVLSVAGFIAMQTNLPPLVAVPVTSSSTPEPSNGCARSTALMWSKRPSPFRARGATAKTGDADVNADANFDVDADDDADDESMDCNDFLHTAFCAKIPRSVTS